MEIVTKYGLYTGWESIIYQSMWFARQVAAQEEKQATTTPRPEEGERDDRILLKLASLAKPTGGARQTERKKNPFSFS